MTNQKFKLYTAGPVDVPQRIQQEIGQPIIYHRDPEFISIFNEMITGIKYLIQTKNDILIFTASGTGGMEAVVANIFSTGDRVLVVEQGKFSKRWSEICKSYGILVNKIELSWQESVTADQVKQAVGRTSELKAVFMAHCETSTGALNDIKSIAKIVHEHSNAIIIVDAISTIGSLPFIMDEWGIDVAVFSSNKGLMNPPGLVFVALNSTAWKYAQQSNLPKYYFSFEKTRHAFRAGISTPFTPAISLVRGVSRVICDIKQLGLKKLWAQHHNLAQAFRSAIKSMGLKIWPTYPSDSLTVIEIPSPFEANRILTILREKYGILVSKGQGKLNNNVIRVGHLGEIKPDDFAEIISALENILLQFGWDMEAGTGLKVFNSCIDNE